MGGSAVPALQEVPLAYVEKETDSVFRVRSKLQQVPAHAPPQRVESLGGGFVLQKTRFVSYRAIGKHVLLWENAIQDDSNGLEKVTSGKASLAIQLPESVAPHGVRVFESLDKQFVSICVVTCAKTVHRFCYKIESALFSSEGRDEVAFAMTSLPLQTAISAVCWLDECNVVVGGDDGAMVAINVGLSIFGHSHASFHEVALADHAGLQWIWGGFGLGAARAHAVVAIVPVPDTSSDNSDTLVLSVSADYVARLWSYEQLACLCSQALAPALGLSADADAAVAASMAFVDNRVLLHATSAHKATDIVLLRGDLSAKGINLDVARRFVIDQLPTNVRLVDFAVDDHRLFSVWRALHGDYVVQHPLALTGPKHVQGVVVGGLQAWTAKHATDDDALPKDVVDMQQIDSFYLHRLFVSGRFNDECLRQTLATLVAAPSATVDGPRLRRALLDAVHRQWSLQETKGANPYTLRVTVWRHVLSVAAKHWATENVPLGFVACELLGSPVLLRRNHMSIFFPSPAAIVSPRPAAVAELHDAVLPFFAAFPMATYYASLQRQWQSDLDADVVAAVSIDDVLQAGLLADTTAGRGAPTVCARTAAVLSGDAATQIAVLDALVAHVQLPETPSTPALASADVAATDLALALHRMGAVVVQELLAAAATSACLAAFLLDAQPSFLAPATVRHLESATLPSLLAAVTRWAGVHWLAGQTLPTTGGAVLQAFAATQLDDVVVDSDLGAATMAFLHRVADTPTLVTFLESHRLHSVLRVVLRQREGADDARHTYLLGECLLIEGVGSASALCFERAVCHFVRVVHLEGPALVVDITGLLKEHLPRGCEGHLVAFLQAALVDVNDDVTCEFMWYNLFKLYVADGAYEAAHGALQRLVALGTSGPSLDECVRYFVLQLCDAGRLDVVCDFGWGEFEPQVEELLLWQAANTHAHVAVARSSQSAAALYRLLYSFYVARNRYVHAARAMYSLFLRLELEPFNPALLEVQRDALLAAANVLELVPADHKWFVSQAGLASDAGDSALAVVTAADVGKQLLLVRGKLALPGDAGEFGKLSAPEVVSLLLTHLSSTPRTALQTIELATALASAFALDLKVVVRAVTRAWIAATVPESLLETVLVHLANPELSLAAVDTALSLRVAVPRWLREYILAASRPSGAGQKLLALLLQHGALEDALATADALVPATSGLSPDAFGYKAESSWLPYALVDTLLESVASVESLQPQATAFTHKLETYFRYVKALDTAAIMRPIA
ncbi:hypothetical protein ACHHYP_03952 [Achlya hypogyna]|uniref:Nuclear pore complex protein n=1 Tax=Achlya hypogyna TaxID=1202772 RepID=A0A1V9Z2N3_ACHHY|nr:hypothetical protein ACHHYP_03952 [Achlya hypogyna]